MVRTGLFVSASWVSASIIFGIGDLVSYLPPGDFHYWWRGLGQLWGLAAICALSLWLLMPLLEPKFSAKRRHVLTTAQGAVLASPAILTGYGVFHERLQFQTKEVDIHVPNLPKDLNGVRIVQISDIHMSPYLTRKELAHVVGMANETRAHLAVVTGDLITGPHDPLSDCLLELKRLKTDAGTLGCLGNHEIFASCEAEVKSQGDRLGMNFLRHQTALLKFGQAHLNIAGVDYQPFRNPYLVGAEKLAHPGAYNLLLSHNPDVFPVAAAKGFDLTLAGHTHGGQVTFEILHQWLNVARIFTPYVYGRYERRTGSHDAALYVTRGIGTVGIPARVGAPPEIALIRLCAS